MNTQAVKRWIWNPYIKPHFRVNYMIIGVQKAGTTALARLLSKHPDIYLPKLKEIHFFDDRRLSESRDYRRYHSYFFNYRGQKMVGEATPSYIYAPYTAKALRAYNPDLKLILILRNPVDRAFSQYNMNVRLGFEKMPFYEALLNEERRLRDHRMNYTLRTVANRFSYKERGLYALQIQELLSHFPREQVCLLRYEEMLDDYLVTIRQIYQLLNVDYFFVKNVRMNANVYSNSMTVRERLYLMEYFSPHSAELERLLGWDLSSWRR